MRPAFLLLVAGLLAACSTAPVPTAQKPDAIVADVPPVPKPLTKLDILWVLDNSPGSSGFEPDLATHVHAFLDPLTQAGIDVQMALISHQQIPDVGPYPSVATVQVVGQFLHEPTAKFPPNAIHRFRMPCTQDAECQQGMTFTQKPSPSCSASSLCTEGGNLTKSWTNPYPSVSCGGDATCNWRCKHAAMTVANDNCSVNSYCMRHCKTDQECRDVFEPDVPPADQRMICYHPGGTPSNDSGCQFPPPTQDCPTPEKMPDLLTSQPVTIDGREWQPFELFRCLATVPLSQTQESKIEGGFRAAWQALDPKGPNCPKDSTGQVLPTCQHQRLVRDDAMLLIFVVEDDDDCSVDARIPLENKTPDQQAALKSILPKEVWDSCQEYGDRLAHNEWLNEAVCQYLQGKGTGVTVCPCDCRAMAPGSDAQKACEAQVLKDRPKFVRQDFRFATVQDWVWRLKTLKKNPNHVLFAAITGLSQAGDVASQVQHDDAVAFYRAKIKNVATGQSPEVCQGPTAKGAFGSRYIQAVQAFGSHGFVRGICDDLPASLAGIGADVLAVLKQIPLACQDADGDGIPAVACGGSDCDDGNAQVSPATKEVCGNGVDDDCDGVTDSTARYMIYPGGGERHYVGDTCKAP